MLSNKGFLEQVPGGHPRMTKDQRESVLRAVEAICHEAKKSQRWASMPDELLALVKKVIVHAIKDYPIDRSCRTCDFRLYDAHNPESSHCAQWHQDIPKDAIEEGCDSHQTHGAPF